MVDDSSNGGERGNLTETNAIQDEGADFYISSNAVDAAMRDECQTLVMSPTATMIIKKAKKKEHLLRLKIKKLNKELASLRQKVAAQANAGVTESSSSAQLSSATSSSVTTSSTSADSSYSSSSSSSTSSEEEKRKKRRKQYKKKGDKKRSHTKKGKKMKKVAKGRKSLGRRASRPTEIIARYKRVLRAYNSGKKLGEACAFAGVTELTVRCKAAIPELAIACPDKFEKLLAGFSNRDKVADFVSKCEDIIKNDADVRAKIAKNKAVGKLIPYNKKEQK
ncbi:uncharacterized protein LOC141800530 [Halichoeres trimaculatus]|uniref:uncharacterized protein LOC141800530 n=1 Tax=Halichoeres trimaculatus TaxID=147232 RepID=UPI003D9EEAE8